MEVRSNKQVFVINNDITYIWESVADIKYENWLKMSFPVMTKDFTVDGVPFLIQIEPTNYCNMGCPICPAGELGFNRSRQHMKLDEFKSIINDMEAYLLFIVLWDWGEPLLNPQLPEMIQYAAERDIKTVTSTNCNSNYFYDENYIERLLRSGLSTLIFAIDSAQEETYVRFRTKGNLQKALQGIKRIVSLKKKLGIGPLLMLRMVLMRQNEHEISAMRKLARELGVERFSIKTVNPSQIDELHDEDIVPIKPIYRRYQYKKGTYQRIKTPFQCPKIIRQCTIHSNGNIVPCCWCYDDDYALSNVFSHGGLTRIWNSISYQDLRKKIFYEKDSIPYCSICPHNYTFSKTGWFIETTDLTQSKMHQYRYLLKRYMELNMNTKLLEGIIKTRNKIGLFIKHIKQGSSF